jgi:hypothetical protein
MYMLTLTLMAQVLVTSKAQASLSVAVRVRPILKAELARNSNKKDIIRVIDGKVVVVLDPDDSKVRLAMGMYNCSLTSTH